MPYKSTINILKNQKKDENLTPSHYTYNFVLCLVQVSNFAPIFWFLRILTLFILFLRLKVFYLSIYVNSNKNFTHASRKILVFHSALFRFILCSVGIWVIASDENLMLVFFNTFFPIMNFRCTFLKKISSYLVHFNNCIDVGRIWNQLFCVAVGRWDLSPLIHT